MGPESGEIRLLKKRDNCYIQAIGRDLGGWLTGLRAVALSTTSKGLIRRLQRVPSRSMR